MGALHLRRHSGRITTSANSAPNNDSDKNDDWCLIDNLDPDAAEVSIPDRNLHDSIAISVSNLLTALGEDVSRNGLLKTPSRVARALLSATRGYHLSPADAIGGALFEEPGAGNGGGSGGMVVVRSSDLFSTCECCLLPFKARCHIAYIPSAHRVVGLSKLPRVADIFAARLQTPQRLVNEVAAALTAGFRPLGVAVAAECWHLDHRQAWLRSTASARTGNFDDPDSDDWSQFQTMLAIGGVRLGKKPVVCPLSAPEDDLPLEDGVEFNAMVKAVECMLETLGEDPGREELKLTATRYARWLVSSTQGSRLELTPVEDDEPECKGTMQTVLDVPFCSQCEHHLLPFSGVAHVGFIGAPVDRGVVESVVRLYSCRLQVQERLTRQVAEAVMRLLGGGGGGVMVVAEASHVCMIARGVRKSGTSTATLATLGVFATDAESRNEFLQKIAAGKTGSGSENAF